LHPECWESFKTFNTCQDEKATKIFTAKSAVLDKAFVNFTHFVPMKEAPHQWAFTKYGLFHAWRRHAAYFMGGQFECVDVLIPIAYAESSNAISIDKLSYMLISIKNHFGKSTDRIKQDFLEEDSVLETPDAKGNYLKPNSNSTLLLSLRTIPFIRGKTAPPTGDNTPADHWIEASESNPYIAFVMSIGGGSMIPRHKRFVPELQVWTCDIKIDH
jgi:hypothetical protein